jgi:hypothetical protein
MAHRERAGSSGSGGDAQRGVALDAVVAHRASGGRRERGEPSGGGGLTAGRDRDVEHATRPQRAGTAEPGDARSRWQTSRSRRGDAELADAASIGAAEYERKPEEHAARAGSRGGGVADAEVTGRREHVAGSRTEGRAALGRTSKFVASATNFGRARSDEQRGAQGPTTRTDGSLADSDGSGRRPEGRAALGGTGGQFGNSDIAGLEGWRCDGLDGADEWAAGEAGLPLFPPAPNDFDGWARVLAERPDLAPATEAQPAVRRVADGLAGGVDLPRTARLRLTGNGVVPLQAAYAWRTLRARFGE